MKRLTRGIVLVFALLLVLALPALGYQEEGGTAACGTGVAYVHATFNDDGRLKAPYVPEVHYVYTDGNYHTKEKTGDSYSGPWYARGDPVLNFSQTYQRCRNFG